MTKQIKLEILNSEIFAYMNDTQLFKLNKDNKLIDIEKLYKDLDIQIDDNFENCISDNDQEKNAVINAIYDNTKIFLDELITKLNNTIQNFDVESEEKQLIEQ